jgi:hypothetical protein
MLRAGFEPTIPALDRAVTVNDVLIYNFRFNLSTACLNVFEVTPCRECRTVRKKISVFKKDFRYAYFVSILYEKICTNEFLIMTYFLCIFSVMTRPQICFRHDLFSLSLPSGFCIMIQFSLTLISLHWFSFAFNRSKAQISERNNVLLTLQNNPNNFCKTHGWITYIGRYIFNF